MSRDLTKAEAMIYSQLEKIVDLTDRELVRIYAAALNDIRVTLSRLFEQYNVTGKFTRAQLTQFVRLSGIEREVVRVMEPYLGRAVLELETAMRVAVDQSYYRHAWAIDQATGLELQWSGLDDRQVRAAVGIIDDTQALAGVMSPQEVKRHNKVLQVALTNYQGDTRKLLGNEVTQGIIQGKSAPQIAKGLRQTGVAQSYRQAMTIARTETLRAMSVGTRMAYEESLDHGVNIQQVWDATLDDRTRPDHIAMDGQVKDGDAFVILGGRRVPGPHETGEAKHDINCRCSVRAEVVGYAPSARRIRDEGIKPYKSASEWLQEKGATANRYGQKYQNL